MHQWLKGPLRNVLCFPYLHDLHQTDTIKNPQIFKQSLVKFLVNYPWSLNPKHLFWWIGSWFPREATKFHKQAYKEMYFCTVSTVLVWWYFDIICTHYCNVHFHFLCILMRWHLIAFSLMGPLSNILWILWNCLWIDIWLFSFIRKINYI